MTRWDRCVARENEIEPAPRAEGKRVGQDNAKCAYAVGTRRGRCGPWGTKACKSKCYACVGPIAFRDSLVKSVQVDALIESDPERAAKRIAAEFRKAQSAGVSVKVSRGGRECTERITAHFVRWSAQGDLTRRQVACVLSIARRGIPLHVFTRNPKLGRQLRDRARRENLPVLVLLSVDCTSRSECFNWDGPMAVFTSTEYPAPWDKLDPSRTVAFPVDGREGNIATVPEEFRAGACPCDMGERHYLGSCAKCYKEGSGCWMHV